MLVFLIESRHSNQCEHSRGISSASALSSSVHVGISEEQQTGSTSALGAATMVLPDYTALYLALDCGHDVCASASAAVYGQPMYTRDVCEYIDG